MRWKIRPLRHCVIGACVLRVALHNTALCVMHARRQPSAMYPPGGSLELTPSDAVVQRGSTGQAVKLLPANLPGKWEIPVTRDIPGGDRVSVPAEHYWPNKAWDPGRTGTNVGPGILQSAEGYDYLRTDVKPPTVPPSAQTGIPIGGGRADVPVYPAVDMSPPVLPPIPKLPMAQVALGVPSVDLHPPPLQAPGISGPNLPNLPSMPPPPAVRGALPTLPPVQAPSAPVPHLNVPHAAVPPADLKGLSNLLGLSLTGFTMNFPKLSVWTPNFPALSLSFSLPQLKGLSLGLPGLQQLNVDKADSLGVRQPLKDPICERDYTVACPNDWNRGEGSSCVAPRSYGGPCTRAIDLSGYSVRDRSLWAVECKAPWPCLRDKCPDGQLIDYSVPCPNHWTLTETRGCVPPSSYSGPCLDPGYPTASYTEQEKERFASACEVSWPCGGVPCVEDFSGPCPVFFRLDTDRDVCVRHPDATWTTCQETPSKSSSWFSDGKRAWATKCHVKWPCKTMKGRRALRCVPDYTALCPIGWDNLRETGLCEPPDAFTAPPGCEIQTGNLTAFDRWTVAQKQDVEERCHIEWPCRGEKSAVLQSACPEGFRAVRQQQPQGATMCKSIVKGEGPCYTSRDFSALALEELRTLTELCNFRWPPNPTLPELQDLYHGSDVGGSPGRAVE